MSIILVIAIISFLIIIHELGHFFLAKKQGIRVEEFGIGYPPKLFKLFHWQGTDFTINLFPLGGFVRLEGEDGALEEASADQAKKVREIAKSAVQKKSNSKQQSPVPFYAKSPKQKILVILAGPIVNFLFGVLAFGLIFSLMGIPQMLTNQPRIAVLMPASPAFEANLPVQVAIEAMQAPEQPAPQKISSIEEVQAFVKEHLGKTVVVYLSATCQQDTCPSAMEPHTIYLRTKEKTPAGEGSMGIMFADLYFKFYPWWQMPFRGMFYGITQALSLGWLILLALFGIFRDLFTVGSLPEGVAGPVGIVHQAQQHNLAGQDFFTLLNFSAMLSINLAIMNLLPIPALDGGRALFILLEKFFGQKKLEKIQAYINYGGFIALLVLMALVTIRDIGNWLG